MNALASGGVLYPEFNCFNSLTFISITNSLTWDSNLKNNWCGSRVHSLKNRKVYKNSVQHFVKFQYDDIRTFFHIRSDINSRRHTYLSLRPKIKFHLFGIAARPTEKLAAQIFLFSFQKFIFFLFKKI